MGWDYRISVKLRGGCHKMNVVFIQGYVKYYTAIKEFVFPGA